MFENEIQSVSDQIRSLLVPVADPGTAPVVDWAPVPFSNRWGWGTAVCLKAAAARIQQGLRKGITVPALAQELAEEIVHQIHLPPVFAQVEAARGYINIFFDSAQYVHQVLSKVAVEGAAYGGGSPKSETVMVEYAQPNTHHSFHIGHLRNAVLGEALARLVEFAGFKTIRASYPGDIGLGVIKCMWGYDKFHAGEEPEGVLERGRWLAQLYTEANALLEAKPEETDAERDRRLQYEAEVRDMYRLWDTGDKDTRALWHRTRQWSLDELDEILRQLDIQVDVFFFESEADEPGKQIVDELIRRGIAEDERPAGGPVIVRIDDRLGLQKETYRTAVILRSDNTSLYLTKDLALARIKFEKYHVDRSIYVVDVRQSLHFLQAFKILELWGFPQAAKCHHLAYEIVTLREGTMSSRKGNVVYYLDVVEEAIRRVRDIIAAKNPSLTGEARETVARQVSLGALKYAMLAVDNTKQIVFSWEDALSFDGQAAPYIQYAHVRAASILAQAPPTSSLQPPAHNLVPAEMNLVDWIARFPPEVQRSALEYKPLQMANYAYGLAKAFTDFYRDCPVLQAPPEIAATRLILVAAAKQTLANSLRLLGIQSPESM
jgi:arginyl-tRNA synthetase